MGPLEFSGICKALNMQQSGRISEYLNELSLAGFVKREYIWKVKTGKESSLSKYRLSDNYLRFFLKYIDKNTKKINNNDFVFTTLSALPAWQSILGLQFENLVLNNRKLLYKALNIEEHDVISANHFFQKQGNNKKGCDIDFLIQTKYQSLYVCEIKFRNKPIGMSIIPEVQHKIENLIRPKGFSCRPVLIHVNNVTEQVMEEDYFSNIIDFGELLHAKDT